MKQIPRVCNSTYQISTLQFVNYKVFMKNELSFCHRLWFSVHFILQKSEKYGKSNFGKYIMANDTEPGKDCLIFDYQTY